MREVLIPRVHERYGKERSALVAAFPTFRSRGAIRELGKVLGLPPGELERVARGAEPWAVKDVGRDVEVGAGDGAVGASRARSSIPTPARRVRDEHGRVAGDGQRQAAGPGGGARDRPDVAVATSRLPGRWAWLARLCDEAYGLPRHLSQHSGGMIVSTRPLIDCCPVLPAAMEGRQLCQWDKDSCADAGFLKIDLLGPRDAVGGRALRGGDRARARGADRPVADPVSTTRRPTTRSRSPTRWASSRSSRARRWRRCCARGRESLEDLTIQVAIVRPGPILGGAVNPYIERLQRLREDPDYVVPYEHPSLEPVLQGHARHDHLPGPGDRGRDGVRRLLAGRGRGAAPGDEPQALGGGDRGLPPALPRRRGAPPTASTRRSPSASTAMIVGFSGFGFPKAHGAAFGLLAYQSTWLRVHYGPEFLCALLNEQPMGFYAPDTLAHEAQRRGIELPPPDVNASEAECTVEWTPVAPSARRRAPPRSRAHHGACGSASGYVLGVTARGGRGARRRPREQGGPFRSLADLASRAGAGRPSLDQLAWAGACDSLLGGSSEHARRRRCGSSASPRPASSVREGTQLALPLEVPDAPALRPLDRRGSAMIADYATTGAHARPAPAEAAAARAAGRTRCRSRDLARLPHETPVRARRARRRAPAAGHREGDRVPAARGRVRHDQPDRPAGPLRATPPDRAHRSRCCCARAGWSGCRRPGGAINVFVKALRAAGDAGGRAADVVALAERRVAAAATGRGEGAQGGREAAATLGEFRAGRAAVQSFASGRRRSSGSGVRKPPPSRVDCRPHERRSSSSSPSSLLGLGHAARRAERRRGRRSASGCSRRRAAAGGSRRRVLFASPLVLLGVGVPAAVIAAVNNDDDIPAGERDATSRRRSSTGASCSAMRCAACHTLTASNAVARGRPEPRPARARPKALVLDAIKKGRANGNGQMPAGIYTGPGRRGRRQIRRKGRRPDRQVGLRSSRARRAHPFLADCRVRPRVLQASSLPSPERLLQSEPHPLSSRRPDGKRGTHCRWGESSSGSGRRSAALRREPVS